MEGREESSRKGIAVDFGREGVPLGADRVDVSALRMPHPTWQCLCAKKKNIVIALRSQAVPGITDQGGGGRFDCDEGEGTWEQGRIHAVATNTGVVGGDDSRVECTHLHLCVCVCVCT